MYKKRLFGTEFNFIQNAKSYITRPYLRRIFCQFMKRTKAVGYTSYSFFVCIFKQTFEKSPLS